MVTATLPARRSLLGKLAKVAAGRSVTLRSKRVNAAFAWVREHVTVLAALTAADLGGFQVCHHGGWFFVAASLVLLQVEMTP